MAKRRRKRWALDYWTAVSDGHDPELQLQLILEIRALKEKTPCARCGQSFPYVAMDFDHVRGKKKFNISQALRYVWPRKVQVIWAEIGKCDIVCANCHRIREFERKVGTPDEFAA